MYFILLLLYMILKLLQVIIVMLLPEIIFAKITFQFEDMFHHPSPSHKTNKILLLNIFGIN